MTIEFTDSELKTLNSIFYYDCSKTNNEQEAAIRVYFYPNGNMCSYEEYIYSDFIGRNYLPVTRDWHESGVLAQETISTIDAAGITIVHSYFKENGKFDHSETWYYDIKTDKTELVTCKYPEE